MDTFDAIATKLETRQFDKRRVSNEVKTKVLETARLTGSSNNTQHWRFILIDEPENVERLAEDSTSGSWVKGASFAVLILTDPKVDGHLIDAGRAIQDMQLTAWSMGIGSGIFTGFQKEKLRRDYRIPPTLTPTAALGFGYPSVKKTGRKKRNALSQIAYSEKYGLPLKLK